MDEVKFLMLPLPAPLEVLCFRVRFRFLTFGIFCFRFRIELVASAFSFFHQSAPSSTSLLSMKQLIAFSIKKLASLLCKLFYLTCVVDRAWHGMEDDFSIFHTCNFPPFHFHSILKIFHSIFHSILKFSSIFHSILPYQRKFRLEAMQRKFCCFAPLRCCKHWRCVNDTKMPQPVSGMRIAHGLLHRRSQDFGLGVGLNRKSFAMRFFWDKEWKIKSWGSAFARNQDFLKEKD